MKMSMSASFTLNIQREDLDTKEKRAQYNICIVGCGRNGLTHACLFADAGFNVIAADKNPHTISLVKTAKKIFHEKHLNESLQRHVKEGRITATTNVKDACSKSGVIALFVPVELDEKEKPDYACIEKTCKEIGMGMRNGSLVLVMTAVAPGITEGLVRETLEIASGLQAGKDFGLAYASPNSSPKIVAGTDKNSLEAASLILEPLVNSPIITVEDIKVAETAHLFNMVQRHTEMTLAGEFSVFCEKAGVDYLEVQKTLNQTLSRLLLPQLSEMSSKLFHVLLNEAESLNLKMRITASAKETAEEILNHSVRLVRKALRKCGKPLRRSRIAVLGVSAKPNVKDGNSKFVEKLIKTLVAKGVRIRVYDPYFTQKELVDMGYPAEKTLKQTVENVDCIVITVPHERFRKMSMRRLSFTMKMPAAIVDLTYIIEPKKAQKEGFVFQGLGRGS